MNTDQIIASIIRLYKTAWETHDEGMLDKIFTADARYIEKPTRVYCGIAEIKKYWRENASRQSSVSFTPKRIINNYNSAAIEWSAHFYRTDLKLWVTLDGTMWLELKQNKIQELTEYFFLTKG